MRRHLLVAAFLLGVGNPDHRDDAAMAFVVAPSSRCRGRHRRCISSSSSSSSGRFFAKNDDYVDEDEDDDKMIDAANVNDDNDVNDVSDNDNAPELALLLPGQRLRVRVGDVSNSRKAWKKRRRNASPILVPCSVLGIDRERMVRRNVVALLHAVGEEMIDETTTTTTTTTTTVAASSMPFLGTTAGKIGRAYRRRLQGDLRRHAADMGHESTESLLLHLFGDGDDGVITFVEPRHGNLVLRSSSSSSYPGARRRARALSSSAGMVRFRRPGGGGGDDDDEDDDGGRNDAMTHTGDASVRVPSSVGPGKMPRFADVPLGAALRVEASAQMRYKTGDEFDAYVYGYDAGGDHGCPLLVLTPEDESRKVFRGGRGVGAAAAAAAAAHDGAFGRDRDDAGEGGGRSGVGQPLRELSELRVGRSGVGQPLRELSELRVGDGPYDATVVAMSARSGAAFVDVGVGRRRGKKYGGGGGGGMVRVLGMLRFEDIAVGAVGDDDVDEDDDDDMEDDAVSTDDDFENDDSFDVIEAGDEIQVYIKAVSKQSGRFMVTLDPSAGDGKARDRKRERRAQKRKGRLLSKRAVGRDDRDDDGDDRDDVRSLVGNVYDGVVKAKSKTGNWYYVKPMFVYGVGGEGAETAASLPVGIANLSTQVERGEIHHVSYSVGDHVRVRLEGIDETRGQLALTLLE